MIVITWTKLLFCIICLFVSIVCFNWSFYGIFYIMFINEVPNNAELSAIIVNELRDLYGIKYRKEKKLKNHQVSREFTQRPNHSECLKLTKYIYSSQNSN